VRAFGVIQKDFLELVDYIEPADKNQDCYSYRTHALLMRTCIEIEANLRGIFADNGYRRVDDLDMRAYRQLDATHRLSSYRVRLPVWHGKDVTRTPFAEWKDGPSLKWYQAYNQAKHNRHELFHLADFRANVDAMCGLVAVLSAQFRSEDFSKAVLLLGDDGVGDGYEHAIGDYFRVAYPDDWPAEERYDFDWQTLKNDDNPFQQHDFK
jgi:hypothetical protein